MTQTEESAPPSMSLDLDSATSHHLNRILRDLAIPVEKTGERPRRPHVTVDANNLSWEVGSR